MNEWTYRTRVGKKDTTILTVAGFIGLSRVYAVLRVRRVDMSLIMAVSG
jgi:hypothetical protein